MRVSSLLLASSCPIHPKGSNSPFLHSHEISKETGGLAGCWHHLVTSFLICISAYLSRTPGDSI